MPTKITINHEDLFAFSQMNAAHCIGEPKLKQINKNAQRRKNVALRLLTL